MYCSEAANVVAMTLRDLGPLINFSYYPVPHLDDSDQIICQVEDQGEVVHFDCDGREFEQCLIDTNCQSAGDCSYGMQKKLATFLECFEGPFANTEGYFNATMRAPCMEKAGLDIAPVNSCLNDTARVAALSDEMKALKQAMMPKLGPNPGTYPHIFIDGQHQWNYSWVALTRIICDPVDSVEAACAPASLSLSFSISEEARQGLQGISNLSAPIAAALDTAISAAALPIGFDEADPKYVNVRALTDIGDAELDDSGITVTFDVLAAFSEFASEPDALTRFVEAFVEELEKLSVQSSASDFSNVTINLSNMNQMV